MPLASCDNGGQTLAVVRPPTMAHCGLDKEAIQESPHATVQANRRDVPVVRLGADREIEFAADTRSDASGGSFRIIQDVRAIRHLPAQQFRKQDGGVRRLPRRARTGPGTGLCGTR